MNAGPELDTLVAEKVMGWRWWRFQPYTYGGEDGLEASYSGPPPGRFGHCQDPPHRFIGPEKRWPVHPGWEPTRWDGLETLDVREVYPVPAYSMDIAAAWLVIETLGQRRCRLILEDWRELTNPQLHGWRVLFDMPDWYDSVQIVAETAPLAICLAALVSCATDIEIRRIIDACPICRAAMAACGLEE